jgi:hypothetical protein
MSTQKHLWLCVLGCLILSCLLLYPLIAHGAFGDCPAGYFFDPRSGVGCKQTYCNDIKDAHWSYEGYCICGSSGSETEDPTQANKECYLPREDASCPGCLAQCVHFDELCPGEERAVTTLVPAPIQGGDMTPYEMLQDTVSKFVAIGSDVLEMVSGARIVQKDNPDAFFDGALHIPGKSQIDIRLFHLNNELSRDKGVAAEWNLIELNTPSRTSWIDGWSLGIGPGAVSSDGASVNVPGTPISPNISFGNITRWFGEQWTDVKYWYGLNMPWYLGGDEPSPIGGNAP